ncbi:aldo/keto reductase [Niameybacter massiliensis]|uniref:Aldo/keto reductase n=1 Tax=Holtiella tumoricola TaxID=3018743 RepID=A0AA42J1N2_9FIRM|nr:aldo/keto reductase [Holtiella tumoricola]MDA3732530.1 aldo/keto reductase [Holtiella tumoricola]
MIYKPYGKTGKMVSAIGFGGMRFRDDCSIEEGAEIVRYANELGINYFDTAPNYCQDRSEIIFGEAFKAMPKDFYVSTKSSIGSDPTADDVRRRLETSLKRMGLEKINFYNMWCILTYKQYKRVIAKDGPYWGALKAKEEGLIEHLVFSTHASGEEIRMMVEDGLFEGVTLGYNAVNFPYRQEGIEAAYKHGLGVVTMNPLGGGLIPQNQDYFSFLKQDVSESTIQAALRFNAAHESISVVLSGMGSKEEVKHNIEAMQKVEVFGKDQIDAIKGQLREEMNGFCTTCQYCKHCPKGINIPVYMEIYNSYILKGLDEARAKYQDNKNWGVIKSDMPGAKDCIKCGKCEKLCTQKLDIINRLEWIVKELDVL